MKIYRYLFLLLILLLSSCNVAHSFSVSQGSVAALEEESSLIEPNQSAGLESAAQAALMEYYQSLNQGRYEQAVALYGGSYEELEYFNPTIDPEDKAALLQAGCEFNGLMCLPILSSELVQVNNQQDVLFAVEFANPDGSLFILGPCCGATEETMPPVSVFSVEVRCDDEGLCRAHNLPPFVP